MLNAAKISLTKMRNSIITYAALACVLYIAFLVFMKLINLMHVTELRMMNYVILCLVCLYQIKKWISKTGSYVPFLQVFCTAFFTGILSFLFFSIFLFVYARFDTQLNELFAQNTPESFRLMPTAIILFEGSAVSIITALINLQYFRRYEEEEVRENKNAL